MDSRRDAPSRGGYEWTLPHRPLSLLWFTLLVLLNVSSAYVPTPATGAAYASIQGRTLFVHGGSTNKASGIISQFFALDLTVPWKVDQPAYKELSSGPTDSLHGMTLTKDQSELILVSDNGPSTELFRHIIAQNAWSEPIHPRVEAGKKAAIKVDSQPYRTVTDMETGKIYVPMEKIRSLVVIDPVDLTVPVSTVPLSPDLSNCLDFSAVWMSKRSSILFYGGKNASCPAVEYRPSTNTWSTLDFEGDEPKWRLGLCMAESSGGDKIVLFGGRTESPPLYLQDIHFLDVATLTWTDGEDVQNARGYHACSVAGDMFVTWGGRDATDVLATNVLMVYDMKNNRWTDSYVPPHNANLPIGAIVGGVVGALFIIALGCWLLYKRRRQRFIKGGKTTEPQYDMTLKVPVSHKDQSTGALFEYPSLNLDSHSPSLSTATLAPLCSPTQGQVRSPQVIPRHSDQIESETTQTSQYIRPFSNAVEPAPQHGSSAANGSNSPPLTYPTPPSTAYRPRAPHAIIDEPTSTSMSPLISASTLAVPSTPGARLMNSEEIELKLKLMEEEWYGQQEQLYQGTR